jgi:hypothetical protein
MMTFSVVWLMDFYAIKRNGGLYPDNPGDLKEFDKFSDGQAVRIKIVRQRNYKFLKKFFGLLNFAYENWEPIKTVIYDMQSHVIPINKSVEVFRAELTILAGYYEAFYKVDGTVVFKAKSIAFANMKEDEFARLYKKVFDIVWDKFFPNYTEAELEQGAAEYLLQYA